jgi:hypothetical protein
MEVTDGGMHGEELVDYLGRPLDSQSVNKQ